MSLSSGVVLLHAFPLDARMYDDVIPVAGWPQTYIPSFGGFGGAAMPAAQPSLDIYADQVVRLLDENAIDRAVVAGTSMGGYVAMALLRRHRDRVSGLVLANTRASADPGPARENRLRMAREVEERQSSALLLDEMLPKLLGSTSWDRRPEVVEGIRSLVEQASPDAVAWAQRAMAARPDSHDVLRNADVPAVVIVGGEDQLIPREDSVTMADALPNCHVVEVPDAGHLVAVENPDAFTGAVAEVVRALG